MHHVPLLIVLTFGVVLVALERVPRLRFHPLPLLRAFFASDAAHLVTGLTFGALTGGLVVAASRALGAIGVPRFASLEAPLAVSVVVSLLVLDFGQYVAHRALHRFDVLWALHKVHHSPRTLDWLAGFRSHLCEHALRRVVAPLGLVLLGAPEAATAIAASILSVWASVIHSNVNLRARALEVLVVTPRLHRVHHVPATTDRNFGAFLTIWDRLFGAFVADGPAPDAALGVPGELDTYPQTYLAQLLEPFRRRA